VSGVREMAMVAENMDSPKMLSSKMLEMHYLPIRRMSQAWTPRGTSAVASGWLYESRLILPSSFATEGWTRLLYVVVGVWTRKWT
jgi:hypothetical protein